MGPFVIVMMPPLLDNDLGLFLACEPFPAEAFVSEFAVEAFDIAVLPGRSRFDKGRTDAMACEPFDHRLGRKLRSVVGADKGRLSVKAHESAKGVDHVA